MNPGWRLVWQVARQRGWALAGGFTALLGVDLLQLYVPRLIKFAVDDLTAGRATARTLLAQAGMILALALLIALLRMVWRPLLLGFSRRVERALRLNLFEHLQSLHLGYLDEHSSGELMARATNDIQNVRMAAGLGLVAAVDGTLLALAAVGFMLYINPLLTALAVLPMPVIVVLTRVMSRRLHRRYQQVQEAFAGLTELARESLSGIRLVKAFALAPREIQRLDQAGQDYIKLNMNLARTLGLLFPSAAMVTHLSLGVILGVGGPLAVLGRITTGDFVAFTAYLALLSWPMMALGWVVSLMQQALSSMQRIGQVLQTQPAINDPPQPKPLPASGPLGIEVRQLSYSYLQGAPEALSQVNLTVKAGATTALVGRIGCGKSTLLALLGRLYDPPPETIWVGGLEVHQLSQADLRAHVVQVPQEAFLFSASVRANLALGDPEASEERLWQALEAADLAEDIAALPKGLDSQLGERAHMLSGGQRQRLALARALLLAPPVLVLDDPLSAVDTETESRILANLAQLRAGLTTLVVSHRLASVAFAQQIYVLDQGRVVEQGSHQQLIQAGGLYQSLFAEQQLLAELEG